jgi:hypothetical protein
MARLLSVTLIIAHRLSYTNANIDLRMLLHMSSSPWGHGLADRYKNFFGLDKKRF